LNQIYFSDPEEIYLVKKNGDVVTYDATKKTELMKIKNPINNAGNAAGKYYWFLQGFLGQPLQIPFFCLSSSI
jgi:hypothetical protein